MNRGWKAATAAVALAAAMALAPDSWAGPAELAPHRAVYAMGLSSTKSGSGISAATGTMSYEFADTCDGWTVENRIAITYAYTEGGQMVSSTDFLTWESKDGLRYRFRLRNTRDGQVTEEVEGTAELKPRGQGGVARFTRPEVRTVKLPKGTLFPADHTAKLLESASSGQRTLLRVVFDGSGTEGPFEVNALIGKPHTRPQPANAGGSPLLDGPSWPMRLAFFPVSGRDALPDFEMALDYFPNGVAQEIRQSFKNFSLKGRLQSIEPLPKRGC